MPTYCGIDGVVRQLKEWPVGVGGAIRQQKEVWAGVDGVNRKIFSAKTPVEITITKTGYYFGNVKISADGNSISVAYGASTQYFPTNKGSTISITYTASPSFSEVFSISLNGTYLINSSPLSPNQSKSVSVDMTGDMVMQITQEYYSGFVSTNITMTM